MTELVSIVIPAFNAERHLAETLRSALGQSHGEIEVIVVDDGSTDSTAEVVGEFSDPRLRLVKQKNAGQSAAINRGVERSRGAYIKLLDADDWINRTHIAAQLETLKGYPDHLASCRWGYFVHEPARRAIRQEVTNACYEDPLEWIVDSLTRDEGMMGGWMWLTPREIWEGIGGYDAKLSLNNDFHFSIALLLASGGVRFAEEAVYSYRKTTTPSLSGSLGRQAMESAYLTTEMGTGLLLERENSTRIRRICADRYQQWLHGFYPEFPDLVEKTEARIRSLGGSSVQMKGGRLFTLLRPVVGWKGVRRLQHIAYRCGWNAILERKNAWRLREFE